MSSLHYVLLSTLVMGLMAQRSDYSRFDRPYDSRDRAQFGRDDTAIGSGASIRYGERYEPGRSYDRFDDRRDRYSERDRFGNLPVDTDRGYNPNGRRNDDFGRRRDDDFSRSRGYDSRRDDYRHQPRIGDGFGGRSRRDVILGHEQLHEPGHMQHHVKHMHERAPRDLKERINRRIGNGASIGVGDDYVDDRRPETDSRGIGNGGGIGEGAGIGNGGEISRDDGSIGTGAGIRNGGGNGGFGSRSRRTVHENAARYDIY
ncbi:unnamed protein product [Bursaphelenchus xylophilus]|uniref:(pine wood nematode) hypothetical protein n=1 Tax=Bursaphelenchus xylophilus TaxID=6326 RepID=A0A1I7RXN3_BURXY|nr:unnamed protein product [Bursaphelenchus xylophilus]CAG9126608.1 unnamed protein product [Bursaphelenchus xylophilus]